MFNSLNVDRNFSDFINWTRGISLISELISYDDVRTNFGDYVMVDPKEVDMISFIPKDKVAVSKGFEDKNLRVSLKIGRFVSKVLSKNIITRYGIRPSDIENFVNIFKSYFNVDESKFQVIEGEEIMKWYDCINYHTPNGRSFGTLWNSCMRQPERNKFMELYAVNPSIKMLIHLDEDGKLRSRALLWEECSLVDPKDPSKKEKIKIMDRIYSIYDHEVPPFKKWARENNYHHKVNQSSKDECYFMDPKGNMEFIQLECSLENHELKYYPYLDTFKFYDKKEGIFRNWNFKFDDFILVQSDGGLVKAPNPEPEVQIDFDTTYEAPSWNVEISPPSARSVRMRSRRSDATSEPSIDEIDGSTGVESNW